MKLNTIASGLVLATAMVVSNASASDVHTSSQAGPSFGAYYGSGAASATRGVDGFYVSTAMYVSGCADRAVSGAGESAYVDLNCSSSQNVSCTFWSIDYDGSPTTGTSASATFTGNRTLTMTLTAAQAPYSSYTSVYCYLPVGCKIYGCTKF